MAKTLASRFYESRSKALKNRAEKTSDKFNKTINNYKGDEQFRRLEKNVKKVGSLMDQSDYLKRKANRGK